MDISTLLTYLDKPLLDKLYGFCYSRTADSYAAEELCSDILYAIVKAANRHGEIGTIYPFIWRIARNVYADYSEKRRVHGERYYMGDPETIFQSLAENETDSTEIEEKLSAVFRSIAFLSAAYRQVMISYYLDGLSIREISVMQNVRENTIRQRLFAARKTIKSEVCEMEYNDKPVALSNMDLQIWGSGDPRWSNPRDVCTRQFSQHVVWLCRNKGITAREISDALYIPMAYVEEELEIQCSGNNGKYGLLRKDSNGRYITNFILLDKDEMQNGIQLYEDMCPVICDMLTKYITENKDTFLAFPYLNHTMDLNLILWQRIHNMLYHFTRLVEEYLKTDHFTDITPVDRPFTVFGYQNYTNTPVGFGTNGFEAENVCGYRKLRFVNINNRWIRAHFYCGHDIANDTALQLAVRAIGGLSKNSLTEKEREAAADAVRQGYLFTENDMLYTKIPVHRMENDETFFSMNSNAAAGFQPYARQLAEKLAVYIRQILPTHLMPEYSFANDLFSTTILDSVMASLIRQGILIPPENGIGAEGCWISVEQ